VKAYVPAEWKGVEVVRGGKVVDIHPHEEGGKKYVVVTVPVNGDRVTIAQPGKAAELAKVDRF
jgi:hypothetical protein